MDALSAARSRLRLASSYRPRARSLPLAGDLDHHSLDNLASSFWTRYQAQGDVTDLHQAVELGERAMDLRPEGHLDHVTSAGNLAGTLWTRYQVRKALGDPPSHSVGAGSPPGTKTWPPRSSSFPQ
ncbi:hypothetical protein BS17DRAFT_849896 [Gyrodon lividus]|nr:hypothetical protein BS17DRAFT_849896 [Gyrodon lividus]